MSWDAWIGTSQDDLVEKFGIPTRCHTFKSAGQACEWPVRIFLPKHLPKTNSERYVPLTPTLRCELARLKTQHGVIRIQGLVFQNNGKKISHTYREVQRLCLEQGIEDFVFHGWMPR